MSTFAQHIVHTLYSLKTNSRIMPLTGGKYSSHEQDNLSNSSGQEIQPNLQVQENQPNSYGQSNAFTGMKHKNVAFVFLTSNTFCKAR